MKKEELKKAQEILEGVSYMEDEKGNEIIVRQTVEYRAKMLIELIKKLNEKTKSQT